MTPPTPQEQIQETVQGDNFQQPAYQLQMQGQERF